MRIGLIIRVQMVTAMHRYPPDGGLLKTTGTQQCQAILKPFWALETSMAEQSMKPDCDAQNAK